MRTDPIYIITFISVAFNIYQVVKRNNKQDTTLLTSMMVKLETIETVVKEMKKDLCHTETEVQETRERLAKVEEKASSAHKRLDFIEKKIKQGN